MAMNKQRVIVLGAALLCTLLATGVVLAGIGTTYGVEWSVIAGGGARSVGSSYAVHGTVGQAAIGISSGASYGAHGGFWYGVSRESRIYLPLVLRDHSS